MDRYKRTIMHLIDTTGPGGAETIFTQLAGTTQQLGYKTIAVIRGEGWVANELKRINVQTYFIDCKGSFNIKFLWSLIELIRRENIILIQSHLLGSNVYASLAGLLTGTPVVSTFHGFVDVSPTEKLRYLKFLLISLGSKRVIAVTDQMKSALQNISGLSREKVDVIANGVDTTSYTKGPAAPLRADLSIPDDAILVGCLGNVRRAKNYNLAIDAIALLKNKGINAFLLIAGDDKNPLAESHKLYAEQKGVNHLVKWLGFFRDTPAYLNSLDVFLLSSSTEGHPLALTQAMAVGVPVVATRCGVEEILEDGKTALLAPVDSPEDIANSIVRLASDVVLKSTLVGNATTKIKAELSIDVMCKKYLACYSPFLTLGETA